MHHELIPIPGLQAVELEADVADVISVADFNNDPAVPYNVTIYGHIFTFLQEQTRLNWTAYKQACVPQYCDIVQAKTVVFRLTEFLGLIGGLWTTVIAVAMAIWSVLDWATLLGPGETSYKVWHP